MGQTMFTNHRDVVPGGSLLGRTMKQARFALGSTLTAERAFTQAKIRRGKTTVAATENMLRAQHHAFTTAGTIFSERQGGDQPRGTQFRCVATTPQQSAPGAIQHWNSTLSA